MSLLSGVISFLVEHPLIVVASFVIYCAIFIFSVVFSKPKPGKNPFQGDTRKPPKALELDRNIRDRVIKQGEKKNSQLSEYSELKCRNVA